MNDEIKIEILLYYQNSRGIGHSKAISEIENVFIVIGDDCQLDFKSKTVKLKDFKVKLRGKKLPIVFDNSAVIQLLNCIN